MRRPMTTQCTSAAWPGGTKAFHLALGVVSSAQTMIWFMKPLCVQNDMKASKLANFMMFDLFNLIDSFDLLRFGSRVLWVYEALWCYVFAMSSAVWSVVKTVRQSTSKRRSVEVCTKRRRSSGNWACKGVRLEHHMRFWVRSGFMTGTFCIVCCLTRATGGRTEQFQLKASSRQFSMVSKCVSWLR